MSVNSGPRVVGPPVDDPVAEPGHLVAPVVYVDFAPGGEVARKRKCGVIGVWGRSRSWADHGDVGVVEVGEHPFGRVGVGGTPAGSHPRARWSRTRRLLRSSRLPPRRHRWRARPPRPARSHVREGGLRGRWGCRRRHPARASRMPSSRPHRWFPCGRRRTCDGSDRAPRRARPPTCLPRSASATHLRRR